MDLNTIWFLLIGIMFTMYAVLDGFDLGVGSLHLLSRTDSERRVLLNSIGPVWDGNEVWLVCGIGSLFGAFPFVYAAAFSGFYIVTMLLLMALIFRAVAIEFRSKEKYGWWRSLWDGVFAAGSVTPPILFGIVLGNIVIGVPVGPDKEFPAIGFLAMLGPYPVLVGAFVLSLFVLHGAIYLNIKTEGELQAKVRAWAKSAFWVFLALYVVTTAATLIAYPHMVANFTEHWWAWLLVALTVLAVANVPRTLHQGHELGALLTSACVIAGTTVLFGVGIFPNFVPSSLNPDWSLTIYNAAAAPATLKIMLAMTIFGIPFVLAYTIGIYWVFRGKVKMDKHSY
jgi:cytochrome bd ubiquinol oxidase subunit II